VEAGRLQEIQEDFEIDTDLAFSFLFALYEGGSGGPATEDDCSAYAEYIDSPNFPVFADGDETIASATPMSPQSHPQVCALSPDLTIISCYSGHGGYTDALDDIEEHAGL